MFQDEKPAAVLLKDCTGQGDLQVLSTLFFEDTWGMVSFKPCLNISLLHDKGHRPTLYQGICWK